MTLISYGDEIVALTTARRCVMCGPLANEDGSDPRFRFVSAMCLYAMQIAAGHLPGPYDNEQAARFARELLIDELEFEVYADEPDMTLAERFGVPVEQVAAKRADRRQRVDRPALTETFDDASDRDQEANEPWPGA